jgi:hypothetical protein
LGLRRFQNAWFSALRPPRGDTPDAYLSPTGFILTKSALITVRFAPLSTFDVAAEKVRQDKALQSATAIFATLLEVTAKTSSGRGGARRSRRSKQSRPPINSPTADILHPR